MLGLKISGLKNYNRNNFLKMKFDSCKYHYLSGIFGKSAIQYSAPVLLPLLEERVGVRRFILLLIVISMIACKPVQKSIQPFQWTVAANIPAEEGQAKSIGYAGPVAGTHNGVLLIGGGANFPDKMPWLGGAKKYHDELWVYNPVNKKFDLFRLPHNLAYSANVSTSKGVVSMGGENETGILTDVLLTKWGEGKAIVTKLPSLPIALTNASATFVDDDVFVAGGETKETVSAKFFKLNLNDIANGWQPLQDLPQPTSHAVLLAQGKGSDKNIYLLGGRKKTSSGISDLYATTFEYNIEKNLWAQKKSLPYALCAGTGAAWGEEYLVLFGGDKGETFHKAETLIAKMNEEKDPAIKEQLNQQKIHIQSTHPGFSKEVLWYNIKNDEWKINGSIPFDVPVTTTAVTIGDKILIPSGEIKAGVRSPKILLSEIQ